MRIAFVVSERASGLTAERMARYRDVASTLERLARADVATIHHEQLDRVESDATVLSGSYDPWADHDPAVIETLLERLRLRSEPVLGICAGMQLLARAAGAEIVPAGEAAGPGYEAVEVLDGSDLLAGLDRRISVWEHHSDEVRAAPPGFRVLARSDACGVEALAAAERPWWGTQFHPETWSDEHPAGRRILENFLGLAGVPLRRGAAHAV